MISNAEKCKAIHFLHGNKNFSYEMGDVFLDSVNKKRDLGEIVQNSLKVEKQCAKSVKSADSFGYDKRVIYK